ncbi:MAG: hypothetical protein HT580_09995 [Dechloromonas sp.]|nr:MAG: hypothetical protein HT580_09995 [Dechloromonas sp.]
MTLTGFSGTGSAPLSGDISYTYTLKAALNQPGATESSDLIALEVTDRGGITTTGTLTVQIVDDTRPPAPTATASPKVRPVPTPPLPATSSTAVPRCCRPPRRRQPGQPGHCSQFRWQRQSGGQ